MNNKAVTPHTSTMNFRGKPTKEEDSVETETKKPYEISNTRALFSRLTDNQINQANETGKIQGKAKISQSGYGGFSIAPNFINLTVGTKTIPAGYELRKDWAGFTAVVPKDSESILLKEKPSNEETTKA
jgi:hypothetical protein